MEEGVFFAVEGTEHKIVNRGTGIKVKSGDIVIIEEKFVSRHMWG